MSLRTPGRRRISPRTKRRYYIVKNFFRKALGNTPREKNLTAVSDEFVRHTILSSNEQIDEYPYETPLPQDTNPEKRDYKTLNEKKIKRHAQSRLHLETKPRIQTQNYSEIENAPKLQVTRSNCDGKLKSASYNYHFEENFRRSKRSIRHDKYIDDSNYNCTPNKIQIRRSDQRHQRESKKRRNSTEYKQFLLSKEIKRNKRNERHYAQYTLQGQKEQTREANPLLDKQFIDDIIRRQYNSVKVYCNSLQSAPLCRDLEYSEEITRQAPDLCSCIDVNMIKTEFSKRLPPHHVHSDLRLCSTDERERPKHRIRKKKLTYESNDLSLDLIPVKEKSSPKSHRKFEGNLPYDGHVEVPPSPTSYRPRLNLQAQDYDATTTITNQTESSATPKYDTKQYNFHLNELELNKTNNKISDGEIVDCTSSNDYPNEATHHHNNEETLKEIKDIIQNFLHEIKKEPIADITHSHGVTNVTDTNIEQNNAAFLLPPPHDKCSPQYPYVPSYYPILPICPMNCAQSSFLPPKINYSCPHCQQHATQNQVNTSNSAAKTSIDGIGAEELIKEIYKIMTLKKESVHDDNETSCANLDCQSHTSNKYCNEAPNSISENCETVDSRLLMEDNDYSASDLDRLSVIATRTDAPLKVDSVILIKKKSSFFNKFVKSFKFLKGKKVKSNACNEMSNQTQLPNVTNLMTQENFQPPPKQPPNYSASPDSPNHKFQEPARPNIFDETLYHPFPTPTAPPYYEAQPWTIFPQIPLCVKEVEVKSVGTQSNIKISIFQKLGLKPTSKHDICKPSKKQGKAVKQERFSDWKESPMFSRKQNIISEELQAALLKTLLQKSDPYPRYPWMKGFHPKTNKYLHQMMKYCKES